MSVKLLTEHIFGGSKLKRRLHRLVWVYTCQNTTLLEITCHSSFVVVILWINTVKNKIVLRRLIGYTKVTLSSAATKFGLKLYLIVIFYQNLICWPIKFQSVNFEICLNTIFVHLQIILGTINDFTHDILYTVYIVMGCTIMWDHYALLFDTHWHFNLQFWRISTCSNLLSIII